MPLFRDPDDQRLDIEVSQLVIAGWAGRNRAAVDHHIAELADLGVAPPSQVPLFYRAGAGLLTTAGAIQVVGEDTSGEAEAVLIASEGGLFVGVGSDHTDRDAEAHSVALAKQACPKPVGEHVWPYETVADHWDQLMLRAYAWIEGTRMLYQDGTLAETLPPDALMQGYGTLGAGSAMFCGTIPTLEGLKPAIRFEAVLEDPVLGRTLSHRYDVEVLPAMR